MLPYQEDGNELERLLKKLFEDDESTPEDVDVFKDMRSAEISSNCCSYNYLNYGG